MTPGSARIGRVQAPICKPIERHGRAPRQDHANQDAGQLQPGEFPFGVPGQNRAEKCEGQSKERVAETNHLQKTPHALEHGSPMFNAQCSMSNVSGHLTQDFLGWTSGF